MFKLSSFLKSSPILYIFQAMDQRNKCFVPHDLRPILEALAREVLRSQPSDVAEFGHMFFDEYLKHRRGELLVIYFGGKSRLGKRIRWIIYEILVIFPLISRFAIRHAHAWMRCEIVSLDFHILSLSIIVPQFSFKFCVGFC